MATKLNVWIETPQSDKNVQAQDVFAADDQRIDGFQAGKPASSIRVNSMLRQSSILTVGFAEYLATVNANAWTDITLLSTVDQVTTAIKNSFKSIETNTLNKANTYTNAAEARSNQKITTLQNTVETNKQELLLRIESLQQALEQLGTSFASFEIDITTSMWASTSGVYTYVLKATTHGRGNRPRIYTYVNGEETYDSPRIDMTTGDITFYSNTALNLKAVIY